MITKEVILNIYNQALIKELIKYVSDSLDYSEQEKQVHQSPKEQQAINMEVEYQKIILLALKEQLLRIKEDNNQQYYKYNIVTDLVEQFRIAYFYGYKEKIIHKKQAKNKLAKYVSKFNFNPRDFEKVIEEIKLNRRVYERSCNN